MPGELRLADVPRRLCHFPVPLLRGGADTHAIVSPQPLNQLHFIALIDWTNAMAGSVNKVILVGNLGRDPEVRTMQSGDKVANFPVATSERWKDKAPARCRNARNGTVL